MVVTIWASPAAVQWDAINPALAFRSNESDSVLGVDKSFAKQFSTVPQRSPRVTGRFMADFTKQPATELKR